MVRHFTCALYFHLPAAHENIAALMKYLLYSCNKIYFIYVAIYLAAGACKF